MASDQPSADSPDSEPVQVERSRRRNAEQWGHRAGEPLPPPDPFFSGLGRSGGLAARHHAAEPALFEGDGLQDLGNGRHQLEGGGNGVPLLGAERTGGRGGRPDLLVAVGQTGRVEPRRAKRDVPKGFSLVQFERADAFS